MNVGIKLKRNKILDSLKRMNVVYSDRFSGVRIQLFKDKMVLILVNPDLGEAMDEIDIMYDGDDLEVGYNVRYLIDAIDVIKEDDILFEIKDESGPGIIRSTENDEYICVVMPIKLRKD
jgi:DNA polymerase-3 subunit beta